MMRKASLLGCTLAVVLASLFELAMATTYCVSVVRVENTPIDRENGAVFARPVAVRVGATLSRASLEQMLRAIGYLDASRSEGGYVESADQLEVFPRSADFEHVVVRWAGGTVADIVTGGGAHKQTALLEPEALQITDFNAKGQAVEVYNRPVPLEIFATQTPLMDALLASEDRDFERHHGVNLLRLVAAPILGGGGSTIDMQVGRQMVLHDHRMTLWRKFNEIGVATALERRYTKGEIIGSYMNRVYAGTLSGVEIHGFGAAAQQYLGIDDVRRLTAVEAAEIVALLDRPDGYVHDVLHGHAERLLWRRNRVLRLMAAGNAAKYPPAVVARLQSKPIQVSVPQRSESVHDSARYFFDYAHDAVAGSTDAITYVSLDSRLQRLAVAAVDKGLRRIDTTVSENVRPQLQAALIALNPRSGEILAMVGGRSYEESPLNRAVDIRRQVGSLVKPFVFAAAFERAKAEGRTDVTPDSTVDDVPTVFHVDGRDWQPQNFDREYAGRITWTRALAESRNIPAVKVALWAGLERVAATWEKASGRKVAAVHPALALGAAEASPLDVALAYSVFANDGLRPAARVLAVQHPEPSPSRVLSSDVASEVRSMMKATFEYGTARRARAAGFEADAAGKTGTTNDLRDAWFAGSKGDLVTVVWVGLDDNGMLGFTGAQAALPIWVDFMHQADSCCFWDTQTRHNGLRTP